MVVLKGTSKAPVKLKRKVPISWLSAKEHYFKSQNGGKPSNVEGDMKCFKQIRKIQKLAKHGF